MMATAEMVMTVNESSDLEGREEPITGLGAGSRAHYRR